MRGRGRGRLSHKIRCPSGHGSCNGDERSCRNIRFGSSLVRSTCGAARSGRFGSAVSAVRLYSRRGASRQSDSRSFNEILIILNLLVELNLFKLTKPIKEKTALLEVSTNQTCVLISVNGTLLNVRRNVSVRRDWYISDVGERRRRTGARANRQRCTLQTNCGPFAKSELATKAAAARVMASGPAALLLVGVGVAGEVGAGGGLQPRREGAARLLPARDGLQWRAAAGGPGAGAGGTHARRR